jgi:hypothetical protein
MTRELSAVNDVGKIPQEVGTGMEGHCWPKSNLWKLLGLMELPGRASLGIGRRKDQDSTNSSSPEQGEELLAQLDKVFSVGHLGVIKTPSKFRQRYYCLYSRSNFQRWYQQCEACARSRGPRTRIRGLMLQYNAGAPFERMSQTLNFPFLQ